MTALAFRERQLVAARVDDDRVALGELALEHAQRQRVEHPPLDRPLQRPRAIGRIIPFLHEEVLRRVGQLDLDLPIGQPLHQPAQLDVDDLLHVLACRARGRR